MTPSALPEARAGVTERLLDILHSEGADSIVLCDRETGDDIAEVFHNERHTVNQTPEQALETARLFAASGDLLNAVRAAEEYFASLPADDEVAHPIYRQINEVLAKALGHD